METIRNKSFEEIYNHILGEIQRGSVDRKHPFHLCFLSTINNLTGFPDSRTVVLRKLIEIVLLLEFTLILDLKKSTTLNLVRTHIYFSTIKKLSCKLE